MMTVSVAARKCALWGAPVLESVLRPFLGGRVHERQIGHMWKHKKLSIHFRTRTGYRLDDRGSIPVRGKRYFSTPQRPDRALGPTQPLIQRVPGALSPGVKRLRREADHSPPSSAEVKNGGAIPPLPYMSLWCGA
jgi:hypothetical protein